MDDDRPWVNPAVSWLHDAIALILTRLIPYPAVGGHAAIHRHSIGRVGCERADRAEQDARSGAFYQALPADRVLVWNYGGCRNRPVDIASGEEKR